jgi:hypothetical protein
MNSLLLILAVLMLTGCGGQNIEVESGLNLYCEMVKIGKESNEPHIGWPDFRGTYDSECQ